MLNRPAALLTALLLAATASAQIPGRRLEADRLALGKMWTFENPPLA